MQAKTMAPTELEQTEDMYKETIEKWDIEKACCRRKKSKKKDKQHEEPTGPPQESKGDHRMKEKNPYMPHQQ